VLFGQDKSVYELLKCKDKRYANGAPSSDSPVEIIIIDILVAVVVIVVLCAYLLDNSNNCMEAVACLLIWKHCYE
jgi:uncharacterized membrane protein